MTISRNPISIDVTRMEIVNTLALQKRVEAMVENICHHELTPDLKDLCQMVYLILLEYDEDKIVDLWEHNEINFFIARIIINQFRSSNSPFHTLYRKYQARSYSLGSDNSVADAILHYLNTRSQAPEFYALSDEDNRQVFRK